MALKSKILIGWKNLLTDMSLTSMQATDAIHPIANLLNQTKGVPTRWDVTSEAVITLKASSATARVMSGLMLKGHNLVEATTLRLRIWSGENQTGTVLYDSDDVTGADTIFRVRPWGEMLAGYDPWGGYCDADSVLDAVYTLAFEDVTGKSMQLDITLGTQPENIVEIDKLALFFAWTPQYNYDWGAVFGTDDLTEQARTVAGGYWSSARPVRRRIDLDFSLMEDMDRNRFLAILGAAGKTGDLYVIPNPNDVGWSWHMGASIYRRTNDYQYEQQMFNGSASALTLREN